MVGACLHPILAAARWRLRRPSGPGAVKFQDPGSLARRLRAFAALLCGGLSALMLVACGGGDGAGLPPTPQEVDVAIAGKVAVKVRAAADQVAVLEEQVVALSTD